MLTESQVLAFLPCDWLVKCVKTEFGSPWLKPVSKWDNISPINVLYDRWKTMIRLLILKMPKMRCNTHSFFERSNKFGLLSDSVFFYIYIYITQTNAGSSCQESIANNKFDKTCSYYQWLSMDEMFIAKTIKAPLSI